MAKQVFIVTHTRLSRAYLAFAIGFVHFSDLGHVTLQHYLFIFVLCESLTSQFVYVVTALDCVVLILTNIDLRLVLVYYVLSN